MSAKNFDGNDGFWGKLCSYSVLKPKYVAGYEAYTQPIVNQRLCACKQSVS